MDFSFSPSELGFAETARAWLEANLPAAWRRDHCWTRVEDPMWLTVARDWQRRLFDGGWAAISWPREQGGRGATVVERWFFDQALDQVGAPRPPAQSYVDLIGPALLAHGTPAQRQRFLTPMVNGDELWCQGFSEPGAGSDLASLRTRAERRGDEYVVNGQKVWTSHADIADRCFLLCRTDADGPKHKGLSLLLVDMKTPGITVRPLRQMTDDAEFCEVFFEDVRVPAENLLGAPGAGWGIAMGIVQHERGPMWTFGCGAADLLEVVAGLAEGPDAALLERTGHLVSEGHAIDLLGVRATLKRLSGTEPGATGSVRKVVGMRYAQRIAEQCWALSGAEGAVYGSRWSRAVLFTRALTIGGGTTDVQLNIIGERLLGLPRDPAPGG